MDGEISLSLPIAVRPQSGLLGIEIALGDDPQGQPCCRRLGAGPVALGPRINVELDLSEAVTRVA